MKKYSQKEILRNIIIALSIVAIPLIILIKLTSPLFHQNIPLASSPSEDSLDETMNSQEGSTESSTSHNDTDIMPNNNITYGGEKYSVLASDVEKIIKGQTIDDKKYVFLTFDDGPSPNTEKILDILKEKDVKATFFVLS